jgi:HK97 family phage major capsid protein
MSSELNPTEQLGKLVTELRSTVEQENKTLSETTEKMEKMEKDLIAAEQKSQELSGKLAQQQKVVDALEKQAGKACINEKGGEKVLNPELIDAYNKYFYCRDSKTLLSYDDNVRKYYNQNPEANIVLPAIDRDTKNLCSFNKLNPAMEQKYLRTDVGDAGGFLVPPEFIPTMLRRLTEISPIRQYASTRTTYSNLALIPIRNVLLNGYWGYEGQSPLGQSQSQYNRAEIHMKRLSVEAPITLEELMDSPFDMQAEISNDVNETFAQLEGAGFVNGTGPTQVEGIMTNSQVASIATGKASDITADSITQMFGETKYTSYGNQMYDRTYMFNRRTWIKILQLKDGQGRYIWSLGNIEAGIPNSILGASYIIAPDMADVSAGTYPIVMGDFKKGYMIVDRMLMYMIRDEVTQKGFIKFAFIRRLGAQVVMPEAFVKLHVAVS